MSTSADFSAHGPAAAELDVDAALVVDADELRDDLADDLRDPDHEGVVERDELPLEADPADVAEQDAAVPYDDEER
jgi:hypothetical protein